MKLLFTLLLLAPLPAVAQTLYTGDTYADEQGVVTSYRWLLAVGQTTADLSVCVNDDCGTVHMVVEGIACSSPDWQSFATAVGDTWVVFLIDRRSASVYSYSLSADLSPALLFVLK